MGGNTVVLPIPLMLAMQRCWRIVGTRTCTRSDTDAVLSLLASGELQAEALVTHRFGLSEVNRALSAMMDRHEPMWMSVVHPGR
jgi:threonine dehydrogenase-like Zn-dependent dehydrogenase